LWQAESVCNTYDVSMAPLANRKLDFSLLCLCCFGQSLSSEMIKRIFTVTKQFTNHVSDTLQKHHCNEIVDTDAMFCDTQARDSVFASTHLL
jgi:hypothetical protein